MSEQALHAARRGDLAVVEVGEAHVRLHPDGIRVETQSRCVIGLVTGVTRDGRVTTIRRLTGDPLKKGMPERKNSRWRRAWIVPSRIIDVPAVRKALEDHPRGDFESVETAREWLRLFLRVLPARQEGALG